MAIMMFPRGEKRHPRLRSFFSLLAILILFPVTASATEQVYYYHNDHLGSPVAITNSAGTVVWRADYEPFGKTTILTETALNTHRFIEKEQDLETGLHYFGARFYDEGIARFLSVDPIIPRNGLMHPLRHNLYAYSLNNPYKFLDPDGREVYVAFDWALGMEWTHNLHGYIVLQPDHPEDFGGMTKDTLGAQIGSQLNLQQVPGSDVNRDALFMVNLDPPDWMSDTQFIQNFYEASSLYQNDALYDLWPSDFWDTYNSNSYWMGLSEYAGATNLSVFEPLDVLAPGIDRPLPIPYTNDIDNLFWEFYFPDLDLWEENF